MAKKRGGKWIIFILIALIIIFLIFSTRIYLAVNLLLGNDVVVKLSSDKEELSLKHGETGNVSFSAFILANPFCSAVCTSEFVDLGTQSLISKEDFAMKPAISITKEFSILAGKQGKGQDIYRFEIKCSGISNILCSTSEENRARTLLLTVNYDLNDNEKRLKNESQEAIREIIAFSDYFNFKIKELNSSFSSLNIKDDYISGLLHETSQENFNLNQTGFELKSLLENQSFDVLPEGINSAHNILISLESKISELNDTISKNVSFYNRIVDVLDSSKQSLEALEKLNFTNATLTEFDSEVSNFNNAIVQFSNSMNLQEKSVIAFNLSARISELNFSAENATHISTEIISEIPQKVYMAEINYTPTNVVFAEPASECCIFGKCEDCCADCNALNYPVILLHGHAFNKQISAEYSLDTFQDIQEKLESEGYLNAGTILISETEKGIWAEINASLTLRPSYYFDIYRNPAESSIIQTKSDSLNTYALRLKDIIDIIKYKTGKSKVIIVGHSMGGLVARKYIQIFGSSDIDRMILIGTPNHGITADIQKFCSIFGEELECRDMDENSLFINKLNYAPQIDVPVTNIIGAGCNMGNETGDGIVTEKSAYLEGAKNFIVNGTCDEASFDFLHANLVNPSKHPEVYTLTVQSLKE
jgi:triacylglycerol esterase/lipase EstA (alpha/beta hydrolase family)